MEDMVEVSEDHETKVATQKHGRDSGIFSTRYSGFFQDGTPLTGSRASDLDHSRYSDPNLSGSLQVDTLDRKLVITCMCNLGQTAW